MAGGFTAPVKKLITVRRYVRRVDGVQGLRADLALDVTEVVIQHRLGGIRRQADAPRDRNVSEEKADCSLRRTDGGRAAR
jgi:hypothetical protein